MAEPEIVHAAVLLDTVMGALAYGPDAVVVDATVGQAGHALALASRLGPQGKLLGLDVDDTSLAVAEQRLAGVDAEVTLVRENFGNLDGVLERGGFGRVDVILADLGFSSAQMADGDRGLSFQVGGPLDMRLDQRQPTTAADLVNSLRQDDLADLIYEYGEERHSRRIARAIVTARRRGRLSQTDELVEVINGALGIRGKGRKSKIHPATRTFQALRIAVNDELGNLERLLALAPQWLKTGGQIGVISFHSLEDRRVKYDFRGKGQAGVYEILTRKPLVADEEERRRNPRSRSAKLRLARRTAETAVGHT